MWCVKSQESSILTLLLFNIYTCSQFNNFCLIFWYTRTFLAKDMESVGMNRWDAY